MEWFSSDLWIHLRQHHFSALKRESRNHGDSDHATHFSTFANYGYYYIALFGNINSLLNDFFGRTAI